MTKPLDSPYPPATIVAIRQAREDLYNAQAERRRTYLLTNKWPAPPQRGLTPVQEARQALDNARGVAIVASKEGNDDADVHL